MGHGRIARGGGGDATAVPIVPRRAGVGLGGARGAKAPKGAGCARGAEAGTRCVGGGAGRGGKVVPRGAVGPLEAVGPRGAQKGCGDLEVSVSQLQLLGERGAQHHPHKQRTQVENQGHSAKIIRLKKRVGVLTHGG